MNETTRCVVNMWSELIALCRRYRHKSTGGGQPVNETTRCVVNMV